jgi:TP901 family phage tail tape measure protein
MASVNSKIVLETVVNGTERVNSQLGGVTKTMDKMRDGLNRAAKAAGVLAGALAIYALKQAADFEKEMANINTLLFLNNEEMRKFSDMVLDLSTRVPVKRSLLTEGLYNVISAGITDMSEAMMVLEHSARLGTAGLGTTKEAVDIMTSAMANFGYEAKDAEHVSDIFFKTVRQGKNTIAELAGAFGSVAPLAAEMSVSFEELQAMTAAITLTGKSASESQTGIAAALTALVKPSGDMLKIYEQLNVVTGRELIESSGGLVNAMGRVREASEILGIEEAGAYGRKEALLTALALLGGQHEDYQKILENSLAGTNEISEAFEIQKDTAWALWAVLKNQLEAILIKLANEWLPGVSTKVNELSEWLNKTNEYGETTATVLGRDIANSLEAIAMIITAPLNLLKEMVKVLQDIIDLGERAAKAAANAALSTPFGASVAHSVKSVSSMFRASGGPVSGGSSYIVGERGPELFVPNASGSIVPNHKLGGGGITININTMVGEEEFVNKLGNIITKELAYAIAY